jgi:hypothetical protein
MPQLASKLLNYSHRNPVRVGRSLTGILLGAAAVLLGFFLLSLLLVTSARAHSIFLPRLAKSRIVNRSMDSPSAANIANSTSRVLPMAAISQVPKSSRPFFLGSHTSMSEPSLLALLGTGLMSISIFGLRGRLSSRREDQNAASD